MTERFAPIVDFGRAATDYGRWRQGFPPETFERLVKLGVGLPGQTLLDLGSGTGLFARAFAERGCRVTGLEASPALLAEAKSAGGAGDCSVTYMRGVAEDTGLPKQSFDAVTAATAWHWFDRKRTAEEARRVLKPSGRLAIAHLDWLRLPGNVIDITLPQIDRFAPADSADTPYSFLYPAWLSDLTAAGFDTWEVFGFTATLSYSRDAWLGRVKASARVGPVMDAETLKQFERALLERLDRNWPEGSLSVDHKVFALVAWSR